MIVFDVDGTLIAGEATDWVSFESAFSEVAGFSLTRDFFDNLTEVTAQAIIHQALTELPSKELKEIERKVRQGYLKRLEASHSKDQSCFPVTNGAHALLKELGDSDIPIAIATGDWRPSISFKLQAAGIRHHDIPMMTSSEFYSRADIIKAAVKEAGASINEAIYVGDGPWDFHASQKLGIPFIGVGRRHEQLREVGATHVLPDLSPSGFFKAEAEIRKTA